MVSIDFLRLERSSGGYEYILVIIDHFIRYAQAYATRNKSAKTTVDKLYNDFILRFGFANKIHHDQGGKFENNLFSRLQQICNIQHSRTTPYHPQGNGQCERFNRTIVSMLRTLPESYKSNWKDHLNKVVHAYNCTKTEANGYSPFFLLFGRHPRLPIDLLFNIDSSLHSRSYPQYVSYWESAMKQAYQLAAKRSHSSGEKAKGYYDQKVRHAMLQIGDRVLVRNLSERGGPGKLRSHWEDSIYIVVSQKHPDSPVYEVKPEARKGPTRTLHRNPLFLSNTLPSETRPPTKRLRNLNPCKVKPRQNDIPPRFRRCLKVPKQPDHEVQSSEEDEVLWISRKQQPFNFASASESKGISLTATSNELETPVSTDSSELSPSSSEPNPETALPDPEQTTVQQSEIVLLTEENFVADTTSRANEVEVISEPIAQPEIYSLPEATTSLSRPIRIKRQLSCLAYFQPGSSFDYQQNMVHANLCNVPYTTPYLPQSSLNIQQYHANTPTPLWNNQPVLYRYPAPVNMYPFPHYQLQPVLPYCRPRDQPHNSFDVHQHQAIVSY